MFVVNLMSLVHFPSQFNEFKRELAKKEHEGSAEGYNPSYEMEKQTTKFLEFLNTMESVDSVRQRLAAIDATLQDVTAIVSGYVGFKASQATSQVEQDTEAEEDKNEVKHEVPAQAEYSF